MHKHRESIKGKVKKVFVFKNGPTSYYNIKLNKHIIACDVTGRHVDMLVEGYNLMVDKKRTDSVIRKNEFGFNIIEGVIE